MSKINLAFSIEFADLYCPQGLRKVDSAWRQFLQDSNCASNDIVELAPCAEDFLAQLFDITHEVRALQKRHSKLAPIYAFKRQFVQRRAAKATPQPVIKELAKHLGENFSEIDFANSVMCWLEDESRNADKIDLALQYSAWACLTPEGQRHHKAGFLFKLPQKVDPMALIPQHLDLRARDGFKHSDPGHTLEQTLDQAHYCIWCHSQGKDSCSKGLMDKTSGEIQQNALGVTLDGCPLGQKISEMNKVKAQGYSLGALALITLDNPMVAATGHRICNDCMKACIFQKQDPVDIPTIESQILQDVLQLPWGFEIYSLLTRWNPLDHALPSDSTGYKILVVGLGPAGFTLAHYLLNEGHTVVAIDGMKIEPLADSQAPIHDIKKLYESLDDRIIGGFGGVAEYGITVRWDKNYLKLIRLLLERRENFHMFGGVRFGSTITAEDAFAMGFNHIALCTGAGKPNIIPLKNGMVRGVRQASDFLMALQLTGAAKKNSIANLQMRLPVVVIGGGLTAVDAATEALAYYPVQVTKFLEWYESLDSPTTIMKTWDAEEQEIANEFLTHARSLRKPGADVLKLLQQWGGVTVAYRRTIQQSPSYRLNHEELRKALSEGIKFVENATFNEVALDTHGHARSLRGNQEMTARTVLIAAGTEQHTTINESSISIFGDLDSAFAGNVVKAIASAKLGYPKISHQLRRHKPRQAVNLIGQLENDLRATVHQVNRLTNNVVEVVVRAPMAARKFQPGQFFRLQNYETHAPHAAKLILAMEGLALTGASVDKERGLISLITLEVGGSSNVCALLQPGEPVALMGPTGSPSKIVGGKNVVLIGGGLGNAVLFSIGKAMKSAGSKVLYFAGYRHSDDLFKRTEIEAAADAVVWSCEASSSIPPQRPQDQAFIGNIVEALRSYANGELDNSLMPFAEVDHVMVIGSDRMMAAVNKALGLFPQKCQAIASINSPMQCMMKGICAQCLQTHKDPNTGAETVVFSCINQDQPMHLVDFDNLSARLRQNSVNEKLCQAILRNRVPQALVDESH